MEQYIQTELDRISNEQQLTILYSCESGSRGWGFASPDSDYDVRFIYVKPVEWYLTIQDRKDQIDLFLSHDLDLNGWDIGKLLRLLYKSNATPYEWLQSPVVYRKNETFQNALWTLAQQYFQPRATLRHYIGLAKNAYRSGLISESEINVKKLFYVLRPLFAALWIAERKSIAPMAFSELMPVLEAHPVIKALIDDLWQQKIEAKEGDAITLPAELSTFIDQQCQHCDNVADSLEKKPVQMDALDQFFRSTVVNNPT